jgi:hypothetical protein
VGEVLNRIWQLTRADLRHIAQSNLIWITVAMVVAGIVLGHLLGGSEVVVDEALFLHDATGDNLAAELSPGLEAEGWNEVEPEEVDARETKRFAWLEDEAAVRRAVTEVDVGFGIVIEGDAAVGYVFRHLMPDLLPETTRRLTAQTTDQWLASLLVGTTELEEPPRELLPGYSWSEKPTAGRAIVPMFVFGEAFIIGLWFGAVLMTGERSRGTIDALRASPAGMGEILTAKALALSIFVLVEAFVTTVGVWGLFPGLGLAMVSAVLLCLFAAGLAFLLSGFFKSLTSFILTGALVTFGISLPVSSLFVPSFPEFAYLPTYPILRLVREAFFPTGQADVLWLNLAYAVAVTAFALVFGGWVFRRRLWGVSLGIGDGQGKEALR